METVANAAASGRLGAPLGPVPVPADCRGCGICCFSSKPDYVRVTGADWSRLGEAAERLAHFIGHRAYMRMREGHCAALDAHLMPDGGTQFSCVVYEQRPQICRDLERGSAQCDGERGRKGGLRVES